MVAKMIYEARALTWALRKAEFNNNQIWYCPCWFFPSYVRISVFSVYKETLTEDDFLTKYCLPSVQLSFPNLLLTKQVALPSSSQCGFLIKTTWEEKRNTCLGEPSGQFFQWKRGGLENQCTRIARVLVFYCVTGEEESKRKPVARFSTWESQVFSKENNIWVKQILLASMPQTLVL